MSAKPDMVLDVNVNFDGVLNGNSVNFSNVQYSQGTTDPASTNVVDQNGDIDLTKMNRDKSKYSKQTDITFHLSGTVTDPSGNDLPIFFPAPTQAITITGHPPSGQFTPSSGPTNQDVMLADVDNDGKTYQYCLNVEIQPSGGGQPVPGSFDPQIINRGNTGVPE